VVRHWSEDNGEQLHLRADMVRRSPLGSNQWRLNGSLYVAFVIDVFARRIVGWRASTSMKTQFVLSSRQICLANRLPGNGRTGSGYLAKKDAR
jgi:transposase InsO family protein